LKIPTEIKNFDQSFSGFINLTTEEPSIFDSKLDNWLEDAFPHETRKTCWYYVDKFSDSISNLINPVIKIAKQIFGITVEVAPQAIIDVIPPFTPFFISPIIYLIANKIISNETFIEIVIPSAYLFGGLYFVSIYLKNKKTIHSSNKPELTSLITRMFFEKRKPLYIGIALIGCGVFYLLKAIQKWNDNAQFSYLIKKIYDCSEAKYLLPEKFSLHWTHRDAGTIRFYEDEAICFIPKTSERSLLKITSECLANFKFYKQYEKIHEEALKGFLSKELYLKNMHKYFYLTEGVSHRVRFECGWPQISISFQQQYNLARDAFFSSSSTETEHYEIWFNGLLKSFDHFYEKIKLNSDKTEEIITTWYENYRDLFCDLNKNHLDCIQ
jgi:hypothetical protein